MDCREVNCALTMCRSSGLEFDIIPRGFGRQGNFSLLNRGVSTPEAVIFAAEGGARDSTQTRAQ